MNTPKPPSVPNRRHFLGRVGGVTAATVAAGALGWPSLLELNSTKVEAEEEHERGSNQRRRRAERIRQEAAEANARNTPPDLDHPTNGDEERYPNKIGSFSKGLPHNSNLNSPNFGEVDIAAFNALVHALRTTNPADFEAIPMGSSALRSERYGLVNPQAGMAFDLEGPDSHAMVQAPPPAFASREEAAEIAENYWMALARDINFSDYNSNPITEASAADLTLFGNDFKGAKSGSNNTGPVTPNTLFRGLTRGAKSGPYISQFMYLSAPFGANYVEQRMRTVLPGIDYMTDLTTWLHVQHGNRQPPAQFDTVRRYIRNGRDLGQWVHMDVLFQAYFTACLVLLNLGAPYDAGNPYRNSQTQDGFGTFGAPHIKALMCEVATRALKCVWYQKWLVHRRLRPEVFAERVHRRLTFPGNTYPVHDEILASLNSSSRLGGYFKGSYLLPMAFPEGSPLHPAYGAGHATVAGACVTILKAWFDESFVIPEPVVPAADGRSLVPYAGPDVLTLGGELDKIASNIAIGRNIAGVHWRSDASQSLKLGEAIAIGILGDFKSCYNEDFEGFSLTKFDGTTVTV
jgi:hypothetical protein